VIQSSRGFKQPLSLPVVKKCPILMVPEGSLPYSQQSYADPYSDPQKSRTVTVAFQN